MLPARRHHPRRGRGRGAGRTPRRLRAAGQRGDRADLEHELRGQRTAEFGELDDMVLHAGPRSIDVLELDPRVGIACSRSTSPPSSAWPSSQVSGWPRVGRGKIIAIASMLSFSGGFRARGLRGVQGRRRAADEGAVDEGARAERGVNVNAITPGYVRTELNQHIWEPIRCAPSRCWRGFPAGRFGRGRRTWPGRASSSRRPRRDYVHGDRCCRSTAAGSPGSCRSPRVRFRASTSAARRRRAVSRPGAA